MVGPSKPIDTRRYFVICIHPLGSCFGSTSPISENSNTGEIYRLNFPVLSLEDVARGGQAVTASFRIERLHAVVGSFMGGMTALAFTLLFPGQAEKLVSISSAARSSPFSIALRSLQRELIRKDPAWRNGQYAKDALPEGGRRLARKLDMITYRSAEEWAERFRRERAMDDVTSGKSGPFGIDLEIESYLQSHAN